MGSEQTDHLSMTEAGADYDSLLAAFGDELATADELLITAQGVETGLVPSIRAAAEGRWDDIGWHAVRVTCDAYKNGSDAHPGSDNHSTLAWGAALLVAWKRADLLHKIGYTRQQVIAWWERELETRLRKGLQLSEVDSRIYVEWEAALICWLWRAFASGVIGLADLHRRYVRACAAQMVLCAYPVKPTAQKLADSSLKVVSKLYKSKLYVALAGSRSWSGERMGNELHVHHLGQSGWEPLLSGLLDIPVPREFGWHRSIIAALNPGWMGLSSAEVSWVRTAVRSGDPVVLDELVSWLDGVGTLWECRLVRFERGASCIRIGREVNGNTRAISTLAIHEDGTIYILASDKVARDHELEPCGVNEYNHGGGHIRYAAWRGGEDEPRKELDLHPDRWGRVVWDVHLQRDGRHVVRRPRTAVPVPPPGPGPEPEPEKPKRDWYDYPGLWLSKLWRWLEGRA